MNIKSIFKPDGTCRFCEAKKGEKHVSCYHGFSDMIGTSKEKIDFMTMEELLNKRKFEKHKQPKHAQIEISKRRLKMKEEISRCIVDGDNHDKIRTEEETERPEWSWLKK